jgi:hypothetical protein
MSDGEHDMATAAMTEMNLPIASSTLVTCRGSVIEDGVP